MIKTNGTIALILLALLLTTPLYGAKTTKPALKLKDLPEVSLSGNDVVSYKVEDFMQGTLKHYISPGVSGVSILPMIEAVYPNGYDASMYMNSCKGLENNQPEGRVSSPRFFTLCEGKFIQQLIKTNDAIPTFTKSTKYDLQALVTGANMVCHKLMRIPANIYDSHLAVTCTGKDAQNKAKLWVIFLHMNSGATSVIEVDNSTSLQNTTDFSISFYQQFVARKIVMIISEAFRTDNRGFFRKIIIQRSANKITSIQNINVPLAISQIHPEFVISNISPWLQNYRGRKEMILISGVISKKIFAIYALYDNGSTFIYSSKLTWNHPADITGSPVGANFQYKFGNSQFVEILIYTKYIRSRRYMYANLQTLKFGNALSDQDYPFSCTSEGGFVYPRILFSNDVFEIIGYYNTNTEEQTRGIAIFNKSTLSVGCNPNIRSNGLSILTKTQITSQTLLKYSGNSGLQMLSFKTTRAYLFNILFYNTLKFDAKRMQNTARTTYLYSQSYNTKDRGYIRILLKVEKSAYLTKSAHIKLPISDISVFPGDVIQIPIGSENAYGYNPQFKVTLKNVKSYKLIYLSSVRVTASKSILNPTSLDHFQIYPIDDTYFVGIELFSGPNKEHRFNVLSTNFLSPNTPLALYTRGILSKYYIPVAVTMMGGRLYITYKNLTGGSLCVQSYDRKGYAVVEKFKICIPNVSSAKQTVDLKEQKIKLKVIVSTYKSYNRYSTAKDISVSISKNSQNVETGLIYTEKTTISETLSYSFIGCHHTEEIADLSKPALKLGFFSYTDLSHPGIVYLARGVITNGVISHSNKLTFLSGPQLTVCYKDSTAFVVDKINQEYSAYIIGYGKEMTKLVYTLPKMTKVVQTLCLGDTGIVQILGEDGTTGETYLANIDIRTPTKGKSRVHSVVKLKDSQKSFRSTVVSSKQKVITYVGGDSLQFLILQLDGPSLEVDTNGMTADGEVKIEVIPNDFGITPTPSPHPHEGPALTEHPTDGPSPAKPTEGTSATFKINLTPSNTKVTMKSLATKTRYPKFTRFQPVMLQDYIQLDGPVVNMKLTGGEDFNPKDFEFEPRKKKVRHFSKALGSFKKMVVSGRFMTGITSQRYLTFILNPDDKYAENVDSYTLYLKETIYYLRASASVPNQTTSLFSAETAKNIILIRPSLIYSRGRFSARYDQIANFPKLNGLKPGASAVISLLTQNIQCYIHQQNTVRGDFWLKCYNFSGRWNLLMEKIIPNKFEAKTFDVIAVDNNEILIIYANNESSRFGFTSVDLTKKEYYQKENFDAATYKILPDKIRCQKKTQNPYKVPSLGTYNVVSCFIDAVGSNDYFVEFRYNLVDQKENRIIQAFKIISSIQSLKGFAIQDIKGGRSYFGVVLRRLDTQQPKNSLTAKKSKAKGMLKGALTSSTDYNYCHYLIAIYRPGTSYPYSIITCQELGITSYANVPEVALNPQTDLVWTSQPRNPTSSSAGLGATPILATSFDISPAKLTSYLSTTPFEDIKIQYTGLNQASTITQSLRAFQNNVPLPTPPSTGGLGFFGWFFILLLLGGIGYGVYYYLQTKKIPFESQFKEMYTKVKSKLKKDKSTLDDNYQKDIDPNPDLDSQITAETTDSEK